MRNILALAVVVTALPYTGIAAQSRFTAPPAQIQQPQMRWANMDLNGDGVITRAEWRGAAQVFQNADWNDDGILSGDEVRPNTTRTTRRTADPAAQQRAARFQSLDSDRDGVVSRWEWSDTWQAFNSLDRNQDDVLSRAEVIGSTAPADERAVGTSGGAVRRGAATEGDIVRVDPTQRWTDTGLYVAAGDRIFFDAEGTLQMSIGGPDVATPGGATSGRRAAEAPLPRAAAGTLIGRIGDSPPLLIGDSFTCVATKPSGNSDSISVSLQRTNGWVGWQVDDWGVWVLTDP